MGSTIAIATTSGEKGLGNLLRGTEAALGYVVLVVGSGSTLNWLGSPSCL